MISKIQMLNSKNSEIEISSSAEKVLLHLGHGGTEGLQHELTMMGPRVFSRYTFW